MSPHVQRLKTTPQSRQIASMIISPKRNFIFIHIPKTGGTSMALALEARAAADDILIGDTPKALRRRGRLKALSAPGRLWKHARLSDIDGMVGLPPSPFIFTLVRNPWDRMVSLYHWAQKQTFNHQMIEKSKSLAFNDFIFDEHVARALRKDATEAYVTDRYGTLRCDAFVRLEHLHSDLAPVEAHLAFPLRLPHANRTNHPAASHLYTDKARDRIGDIFSADIARFGYRFPNG